jgi:two-component system response regulator
MQCAVFFCERMSNPVEAAPKALANILVVEDDENDYRLLKVACDRYQLKAPLHWVMTAHDAISYLKGEGVYQDRAAYPFPCLLLLDIDLIAESGFEALKWIRQQPELDDLHVWVYSNSLDATDATRAYQMDANSYVVKPATTDEWKEFVKSLEIRLQWLTESKQLKSRIHAS